MFIMFFQSSFIPAMRIPSHFDTKVEPKHLTMMEERKKMRVFHPILYTKEGTKHLTMTDKRENAWTTTTKFKTELMELAAGRTVIELGAHVGYSTEMLANVSKLVFACEMSEEVLKQNMERTAALSNVVYFQFHSVFDDWTKGFPRNKIDLAFLDAAHDKASVLQDLERLHKLGIPVVALDDYGAEKGVKLAVHEFVDAQKAVVRSYIGEAPPWHFADRTIHEHEGIVLDMLDAGFNAGALDKQPIGRWAAYPLGVFLTGDFSPVARIDLRADGTGAYEESNATMFRKLFWRK
eukprot:GEMP01046480.1.p1 GENE.GEMP01046480.1~~GEMP01046480.1.p1  ORF type:complete len:293 (+),score=50.41 GEMP01046480.1:53-931(+)